MDKEIKGRLPPFTEALINHTKEKQFPLTRPATTAVTFTTLQKKEKRLPASMEMPCLPPICPTLAMTPATHLPMKACQGQRKNWQPTPSAQTGHGSSSMALPFPTVCAVRRFLRKTISSSLTGTAINPSTRRHPPMRRHSRLLGSPAAEKRNHRRYRQTQS